MNVGDAAPNLTALPTIITVFNQKGGVAKTTTSVNLAVCLAAYGRRVALIDLDSQGNATTNLGISSPVATGAYDLITGRASLAECLRPTPYDGLRLVGASDELAWADIELALKGDPEAGLTRAFANMPADLDDIVIDCPPAPGVVSVNALVAAHVVVMPVMPSPHALDGLHKAWRNVNRVRSRFNHDLHTIHILLTMTEDGALPQRLANDIIAEFGPRVMLVQVPRDNTVIEAAARDLPITVMAAGSPSARAYLRVADLLLARMDHGDDLPTNRLAALDRLAHWHEIVAQSPAHAGLPGAPEPGLAPDPAWVEPTKDDEPATTPSRWGWKLSAAVLLLLLGAVLGFAGGVTLRQGGGAGYFP